jgi:hypothetical protein
MKHARGRSLSVFSEKLTTRILWHVASKLIWKKKNHLSAQRSAISKHFLMGRTCAGSECSKNLEHLGPRDIVVDTTPIL